MAGCQHARAAERPRRRRCRKPSPPPRPQKLAAALHTACSPACPALPPSSLSDPVVLNWDHKPVEEYAPLKKKQRQPVPPLNREVRCRCCCCCYALLGRWCLRTGSRLCSTLPDPPPAPSCPLLPPWPCPQAAQAQLAEAKEAKQKAKAAAAAAEDDDDTYVYLPPGSSMRDPMPLPSSLSDPLDRKVGACRARCGAV